MIVFANFNVDLQNKKNDMRKIFIIQLVALLFIGGAFAQKKKKKQAPEPQKQETPKQSANIYRKMYQTAMKYNDASALINALYLRMASGEEDAGKLRDTLGLIYFRVGNFVQAISVAEEIIKERPQDTTFLEVLALSYQNLNDLKSALKNYEELYKLRRDLYDLYNIASIQYFLQRFGEAHASVQRMLLDPRSAQEKIRITINKQQQQEVPVLAAAYNMQGVLFMAQKEYDKAEEAFKKALQIDKSFALPQGNMEMLAKLKSSKQEEDKK